MRIVCIDDEKLALDLMTHLLSRIEGTNIIGIFQNPQEGLKFVNDENVDVVFLDIDMPGMNGLQLAERILEKKPFVHIVFVTAYHEYAVTAFELNAIDYLLKPVKVDRLQKTIKRLRREVATDVGQAIDNRGNELLRISLARNVSFGLEEEPLNPLKWRTSKARELFLYLLQNQGKFVHKGTLMETIWGEEELDRGFSILYTTVYNVRKAIQAFNEYLQLTNTNDGYILEIKKVQVDLFEWEKAVAQLPNEINEKTIKQFIETMELNTGPYLSEYDFIWVEAEKQRLENLWIEIAEKLANYFIRVDDFNQAIEWLLQIVIRVPESEKSHLTLMKLFAEQHKYHEVIKQYDEYVKVQKSFDLKPSAYITKWYKQLLADIQIKDE